MGETTIIPGLADRVFIAFQTNSLHRTMLLTFAVNSDGMLVISADARKIIVGPKTSLFRRSMGPGKAVLCLMDTKVSMTIEGAQIDVSSYNNVADMAYSASMSLEEATRALLAKWNKGGAPTVDSPAPASILSPAAQSIESGRAEPIAQEAISPDMQAISARKRPRLDEDHPMLTFAPKILALADDVMTDCAIGAGMLTDERLLEVLRQQTPFDASAVDGVSRTEVAHVLLRLLESGSITVILGQPVIFRR